MWLLLLVEGRGVCRRGGLAVLGKREKPPAWGICGEAMALPVPRTRGPGVELFLTLVVLRCRAAIRRLLSLLALECRRREGGRCGLVVSRGRKAACYRLLAALYAFRSGG